jgi:hypothetical protein
MKISFDLVELASIAKHLLGWGASRSLPKRENFAQDEITAERPSFKYAGFVEQQAPTKFLIDEAIKVTLPCSENEYKQNANLWNSIKWGSILIGSAEASGSLYKGYNASNNVDWVAAGILGTLSIYSFYRANQADNQEKKWQHPLESYKKVRMDVNSNLSQSFLHARNHAALFHRDEIGHCHYSTMFFWNKQFETSQHIGANGKAALIHNFLQSAPLDHGSTSYISSVFNLSGKQEKHLTPARLSECSFSFDAANQCLNQLHQQTQKEKVSLFKAREDILRQQKNAERLASSGTQVASSATKNLLRNQHNQRLAEIENTKNRELEAHPIEPGSSLAQILRVQSTREKIERKYDRMKEDVKRTERLERDAITVLGIVVDDAVSNKIIKPQYKPTLETIEAQIAQKDVEYEGKVDAMLTTAVQEMMSSYFRRP